METFCRQSETFLYKVKQFRYTTQCEVKHVSVYDTEILCMSGRHLYLTVSV